MFTSCTLPLEYLDSDRGNEREWEIEKDDEGKWEKLLEKYR